MPGEGKKVEFHTESFQVEEASEGDGAVVTGLALPFGETSRNGVEYDKDSVKENMGKMEGRSVLVNHDMDRPIGHVEEVNATDEGMVYRMNIDPEEKINNTSAVRKFERGDVKNVSISAFVERVEGEQNLVEVKDFAELSAVTVPGFPQTSTNPESVSAVPITEMVDESESGEGKHLKDEDSKDIMTEDSQQSEAFVLEDFDSVEEMLAEASLEEVAELLSEVFEVSADEVSEVLTADEADDGDMDDGEDDEDDEEDEESVTIDGETYSKERLAELVSSDEGDDESDDENTEDEDTDSDEDESTDKDGDDDEDDAEEDEADDGDDSDDDEDDEEDESAEFGGGKSKQDLGNSKSEGNDFRNVIPKF